MKTNHDEVEFPPPGHCCHWYYEDLLAPTFEQEERVIDGKRVMVPVMVETPYEPDPVIARPRFFTPEACPRCEGSSTCVECGRKVVAA